MGGEGQAPSTQRQCIVCWHRSLWRYRYELIELGTLAHLVMKANWFRTGTYGTAKKERRRARSLLARGHHFL